MTFAISQEVNKALHKLYYDDKFFMGRDKVYKRARELSIPVSRRQVQAWLKDQELYQLTAPSKPVTSEVSSTVLKAPLKQIGIDLIDYANHAYKSYKWILTAVDLFSKYVWAYPMKSKTDKETAETIDRLLSDIGKPVRSIRSDNGPEFKNAKVAKVMAAYGTKQIFSLPYKPWSNGTVEKANQHIKNMINKYFLATNKHDWVDILPTIIDNINASVNDTTKRVPQEVAKGLDNEATEAQIRHRLRKRLKNDEVHFAVRDKVRIKQDEGQRYKWSPQLYYIAKIIKPKSSFMKPYYVVNSVKDNEQMPGKYYNDDLMKVRDVMNKTTKLDKFVISRIIRPATSKGTQGYIVKWKNHNGEYFQERSLLLEDLPKVLAAFDKKHKVVWYPDGRYKWSG